MKEKQKMKNKKNTSDGQVTFVRLVEEFAASLIVLTVLDNQPTVVLDGLERVLETETPSESLIVDVDRRSCRVNSWFSHNAWVNSNFFSANSISTRFNLSLIAKGLMDIKSSSGKTSRSGLEGILDGGEPINDRHVSQQLF